MEEDLARGIKVVDVGCGAGNWVMDMAQDYPASTFIGVDVGDTFPEAVDRPPNCNFLQADVTKGLPFEDNSIDYVFERALVGFN